MHVPGSTTATNIAIVGLGPTCYDKIMFFDGVTVWRGDITHRRRWGVS